jgi:hypothetical protein
VLPLRLLGLRVFVGKLPGGNPIGGAPVGLGDVVLDVLDPDAPNPPSADLNSTEVPCFDSGVPKRLVRNGRF